MSHSNHPRVDIGCPECNTVVSESVPPLDRDQSQKIDPNTEGETGTELGVNGEITDRLRGTETNCRNCGHELGFYYY